MADSLACVFIPCDAKNPYQRALAAALEKLGVRVEGRPWNWRLLRQARGARVVHIHWTAGPANARLWKFAFGFPALAVQFALLRLLGRRIVWTVHNLESHEKQNPRRDRLVSLLVGAMAHGVIVHGQAAKEAVLRRFHIPARKVRVIPHGNYDGWYPDGIGREEARRRLGLDPAARVLLFLGNIRPYKGVTELIEAFHAIADPLAALVLAGRPLNAEIEAMVAHLVAGDERVKFHPGFVEDAEVQVYMNAADAVVFPYREVLTSGAVLLAMSFARGCVAPRLGCILDVLDDRGAFLYDAEEARGLSGALRAALGAGDRLMEMGRWNQEKSAAWSWDRIAAETLEVYRPAPGNKATGPATIGNKAREPCA